MKFLALLLSMIALVSCSSVDVKRTHPIIFSPLFIAKVEGIREVILEPNESKSERVLVGLIFAGPLGAIATANTEEGFSKPKAFEYTLLSQVKWTPNFGQVPKL
ncbi:hypothetical protein DOQ08_02711 [Marinobacter litoralis]|uniref:Lipoprotein n=1 Tax=Marinobacter litoralis TaxID=187981 RepID=A0A3M2R9Z9_9GAMM|nr:hypothetical protein [Marinobacter litoralis]RMJ01925.1 hypothetical protein DOQ08_02711 [Marinobacter litoralis]